MKQLITQFLLEKDMKVAKSLGSSKRRRAMQPANLED
jgi:hypothetical protein